MLPLFVLTPDVVTDLSFFGLISADFRVYRGLRLLACSIKAKVYVYHPHIGIRRRVNSSVNTDGCMFWIGRAVWCMMMMWVKYSHLKLFNLINIKMNSTSFVVAVGASGALVVLFVCILTVHFIPGELLWE